MEGDVTGVWESTPNSGGYYHASGTYWANELLEQLNLYASTTALIPQVTYNPDGEGRVASTSVTGSGQDPLTGTNYNVFGEPTSVTLGSGDSDSFSHDPNTGRMTQYKFTVNGSSVAGNLGWNANGTLATMSYYPWGGLETLTNGCAGSGCTQAVESYDYNDRLQPIRIQLGTSSNADANYCLVYNY